MPPSLPTRRVYPDTGVVMSETAPEIDADAEQVLAEAVAAVEPAGKPEPTEPDRGTAKPADPASDVAKWKALARKHETAAKANAEAARKLAEYEDAQKTEQERANERAADAERQLNELQSANARLRAATLYGIPAELVDLLGDGTDEQISERAELLAARLTAATAPPATPSAPPATRPVESLKPGAAPAGGEQDPNAWLRNLAGRT